MPKMYSAGTAQGRPVVNRGGTSGVVGKGGNFQNLGDAALRRLNAAGGAPAGRTTAVTTPAATPNVATGAAPTMTAPTMTIGGRAPVRSFSDPAPVVPPSGTTFAQLLGRGDNLQSMTGGGLEAGGAPSPGPEGAGIEGAISNLRAQLGATGGPPAYLLGDANRAPSPFGPEALANLRSNARGMSPQDVMTRVGGSPVPASPIPAPGADWMKPLPRGGTANVASGVNPYLALLRRRTAGTLGGSPSSLAGVATGNLNNSFAY